MENRMRIVKAAVVLGVFLLGIQIAFCADVSDSFDRPDSNAVGKTEAGNYKWVEIGDNMNGNLIAIREHSLQFHYFFELGTLKPTPNLACNLAELKAKNIDLSVVIQCNPRYGGCYGVSYRLAEYTGKFDSPGYHVILNSKYTPYTISLKYGGVTVAKAIVVIPHTSKVRIVANGSSHKIYLNGNLEIDVTDSGETEDGYVKTDAGYVGLCSWYGIPIFRDFSLTLLKEEEIKK
ncbi:MAG: hypothetical protein Q7J27_10875 [Syntrophales bacterium]|nr:hypothetical protein [Syntrophales bacterium]